MGYYYHMRWCGGTWTYCDGVCDTCIWGMVRYSNSTEEQKKGG